MERIMIQLDSATLAELDEAAKRESVSRSALAREAIEMALAERRRRMELEQVRDSFRQRPQEDELLAPERALRKAWPD